MRIHQHFSVIGFCNTYIIGNPETKEALIIDPGHADYELIRLIEQFEYTIKAVFLTHRHSGHTEGLSLLSKLYRFDTYAYVINDLTPNPKPIIPNKKIRCASFDVLPVLIGGHSSDSIVFLIEDALFSGDTLHASHVGKTYTNRLKQELITNLTALLSHRNPETLIFPGHGPPSTVQSEFLFNPSLT